MKRLALLSALLAAGCSPFPSGLDTHGNAPLIVDLDDEDPVEVGVSLEAAEESGTAVRGPDKGSGERGGLTASFVGNGGQMCVILDPEGDFDGSNHLDDGDMDLLVGRAADYTGTPGSAMGQFTGDYEDALGIRHEFDQNLCVQYDRFGMPGAHAGAGTPEYCQITADAGVPYILQGETFSVPPDDQVLTVSLMVLASTCPVIDEDSLEDDE